MAMTIAAQVEVNAGSRIAIVVPARNAIAIALVAVAVPAAAVIAVDLGDGRHGPGCLRR